MEKKQNSSFDSVNTLVALSNVVREKIQMTNMMDKNGHSYRPLYTSK